MPKFLIVDDSPIIRRFIRAELEVKGAEIREVSNGEEALALLQTFRPSLITLDVQMPVMDGFETCRRIRSGESGIDSPRVKDVPIVFITGNDTLEDREKGFSLGATEFLTKPFHPGELRKIAEELFEPHTTLKNATALVVDDSRVVRRVVKEALAKQGVDVLEAEDGPSALKMYRANRERLDLIVTDYVMPGMNGDQLAEAIRADDQQGEIPIIIMSALTERDAVLTMFKAGATDYLIKPFATEELVARINVHLRARNLNRELEEKVAELTRLNAMKDEFLAITSHDLRSPLTGMMGYADLMLAGMGSAAQQKDFLGRIKASGTYLLELINDLLDLGRIQSGTEELDLQPVSLLEVAESALSTLQHMASPKEITLSVVNGFEGPPMVAGDRNSLLRILNNLISNGIKFTPEGGTVNISLQPAGGGRVRLSVIDSGIGIPEENIPHLFDTYSKTSQKGTAGEKGTGLGLAITLELTRKHKGAIEVFSKPGEGAEFRITFPAPEPGAGETPPAAESA